VIELRDVSLRIGVHSMHNVQFLVPAGQSHVLLGPSGAGKTLLLESILGLRPLLTGQVLIGGQDVTTRPPESRGIGYMPQDSALFPHLSVRDNMLFGRRVHGTMRDAEPDLAELCDMLQISGKLKERANISSLSGGEQQRVALARALITKPKVLLLDESFSALDADIRRQLLQALRRLQQARGQTLIYVTHHQDDAEMMADQVTIMVQGAIAQTTAVNDMCRRPRTLQIAHFLQLPNIFPCSRLDNDPEAIDICGMAVSITRLATAPDSVAKMTHVSLAADLLQVVAPSYLNDAVIERGTRLRGVVEIVGYNQRRRRAWVRLTHANSPCILECDVGLWQAIYGEQLPTLAQSVDILVPSHAVTPIFNGAPA
jgi:ABC-type Fe3+/spermidine/putrescine transport system ATPase subunit